MDLTCLNNYPPLPPVPKTSNDSNTFVHPTYEPGTGGIAQMISAFIFRSTFSTNDIHSLLNELFNKDFSSWNVSEIIKTKPIPSLIIYTSIALALFLIFSIIFCIVSCRNSNKYQRGKRGQSKTTKVCVSLLIIIYLLGIGDMIYVAYRVNKSTSSIDNTIKEVNRDVYPREISEHMVYFTKQLNRLDQYCVQSNSILINASKSMVVKAFDGVLKDKYFIEDIVQSMNSTDEHVRELSNEIDKHSLPESALKTFREFQERYRSMIVNIQMPLTEICAYANGTETNIDKKLLEALNIVHEELKKVNETIHKDIINKITPWQYNMLLDIEFEEQIRSYINLVGTSFFGIVIALGGIPLIFFVFIIISRLCCCGQNQSYDDNLDRIPMTDVMAASDTSPIQDAPGNNGHHQYKTHNRVAPVSHYGQRSRSRKRNSNNGPSGVVLCLMRIAFIVMIILLVALVLLTGIYYALDLAIQSTCRTIHDDQPFLINLVTDKLIKSNVIFGNSSEMNTTINNIIQDCGNQVHFSEKLLKNYWSTLNTDISIMMNTLSEQIFDEFINSMGAINITSDIDLLDEFIDQANVPTITIIVQKLDVDLAAIEAYFEKISSSNSTLPPSLVQITVDEFDGYVKKVLESTIDGCPLPLATVSKTDILTCHTMGGSLDGLWLSVFFFMSLITIGLCIFGVCVYKRLN